MVDEALIRSAYLDYCTNWNPRRAFPVGLNFAIWMTEFINRERPKRAADLGSGFTSWALRASGVPYVVSYDAHEGWAAQTRLFLRHMAIPDDDRVVKLLRADSLPEKYDFIIVDTAFEAEGSDREDVVKLALNSLNLGGYILLDDFNWGQLRVFCQKLSNEHGVNVVSLTDENTDKFGAYEEFGRWAGLIGPR